MPTLKKYNYFSPAVQKTPDFWTNCTPILILGNVVLGNKSLIPGL